MGAGEMVGVRLVQANAWSLRACQLLMFSPVMGLYVWCFTYLCPGDTCEWELAAAAEKWMKHQNSAGGNLHSVGSHAEGLLLPWLSCLLKCSSWAIARNFQQVLSCLSEKCLSVEYTLTSYITVCFIF